MMGTCWPTGWRAPARTGTSGTCARSPTGKDRPDVVKWIKFGGASWTHDNLGFYYSRYDEPKAGSQQKQLEDVNYYNKLFYHRLGTPQAQDALVYERKDHKDWQFNGGVTDDGRYLIHHGVQGDRPQVPDPVPGPQAGGRASRRLPSSSLSITSTPSIPSSITTVRCSSSRPTCKRRAASSSPSTSASRASAASSSRKGPRTCAASTC